MPYNKDYTMNTVKKAEMKTPKSVMGGQGSSANIIASHYVSRATKNTPFPGGHKSKKSK
jgi:hypothetical protein